MSVQQQTGRGPETASTPQPPARPSRRPRNPDAVWRVYFRKPLVRIFMPILVFMILASLIGPLFSVDPFATAYPPFVPPGQEFLLGTDNLGRDYLARVLMGGQVSLLVGFSVALLCMTLALIVGGIAGFYGGFMDTILVKVSEFFQVIPGIILALVAASILGANVAIIVVILSLTMWPGVARIVRAEAMRISQLGYVESQRAGGFLSLRILWSDVLPNAMPPVLVATTMTVARAILAESGLSFLGIGDANRPSWGALLNQAQPYISTAWWLAVFPGLCIFLVVLAINLLGDALNDALNPSIGRVK